MSYHALLTILFVALTLWASGRYLWSAIQGKTVPHFVTWFAMGVITGIAAVVQLESGASIGSIPLFVAAAMNFGNCVAGYIGWQRHLRPRQTNEERRNVAYVTKTDYASGVTALAAVALWRLSDDPSVAVILLAVASLFAFWPTIRRSWAAPSLELLFVYKLGTLRYIVATLAVEHYAFATVLYPATWIGVNAGFTLLLMCRARAQATA